MEIFYKTGRGQKPVADHGLRGIRPGPDPKTGGAARTHSSKIRPCSCKAPGIRREIARFSRKIPSKHTINTGRFAILSEVRRVQKIKYRFQDSIRYGCTLASMMTTTLMQGLAFRGTRLLRGRRPPRGTRRGREAPG